MHSDDNDDDNDADDNDNDDEDGNGNYGDDENGDRLRTSERSVVPMKPIVTV